MSILHDRSINSSSDDRPSNSGINEPVYLILGNNLISSNYSDVQLADTR